MNLLSLVCRSGFAGSDGPYRFVGDDQFRELFGSQVEHNLFDLSTDHIEVFSAFAFFEFFADAIDRNQVVLVSLNHLFIQRFAGFTIIFAAFAVAEDHVIHTQRGDHFC